MIHTAWVFPGQGSQAIGMGIDLLNIPKAKTRFEHAEKILGWSVPEVCQSNETKLSRTLYTQPCLFVVESILVDLMKAKGFLPNLVAGHSLGEYVALYAAGVFDFETGLKLVKRRSELMDTASGGQMVALIGFDRQQLELQIQYTSNVVLANDNSDSQVVISGKPEVVEDLLSKMKVKRAVKLNVSGAFHSPLMQPVASEFEKLLRTIRFSDAKCLVMSNVEPTPTTDGQILKNRLMQQMVRGVRWREICLELPLQGIEKVVEIGPGKVLTGLIKRSCPNLTLENVSSAAEVPNP
jgi:[acyl-carrier-protein] S-malonyltransferase